MKYTIKSMFSLLLVIILSFNLLQAQKASVPDLKAQMPADKSIRIGTLSNGLKYYIKVNKKPEKRAEFLLVVKAGSVLEDNDQQGLAHFTEHMAFNGTKHFPKNDLVNFLESTGIKFGADLNAFTSFDQTVYMLQLPTDKKTILYKGLEVLRDWSGNLLFDPAEIEKERGVIMEEWRLGKGAFDRVSKKHNKVIYYHSRYGERLPIGDTAVILHAPRQNFTRFYNNWYRPDLMAVIAVGDFNPDEIEKLINKEFSQLKNPKNEKERTWYTMPANKGTLVSIAADKELPYPMIQIYSKLPHRDRGNYADYRESIKADLFTSMLNNRLQEISRKSTSPFVFAMVNEGSFLGKTRAFTMVAVAKNNKILETEKVLLAEMYRVKQHGFTKTELERAKKESIRSMEQAQTEKDKTESKNYAFEYMRNFMDNESIPGIDKEVELYKLWLPGINIDTVNQLVDFFIKPDNNAIAVSVPKKEGIKIPTKNEVLGILNETSKQKFDPYVDLVSNKPLMSKIPAPGKIISEKKYDDIGATEWTLSNGVKVLLKPTTFKNDEITMYAYSPGGYSIYGEEAFRDASMAASVINSSGISDMNEDKLRKLLSGKIVNVSPIISTNYEGFRGNASTEDLTTMFQLIYLYFNEARIDNEALKAMKDEQKTLIENSKNSPSSVFRDTVRYVSSGYHYSAKPWTIGDLDKINGDKMFDIYYDRFADASDFTFIFVGNIDIPKMKKLSTTYLANLPTKNRKETWKDTGERFPEGDIERTVYKGIEPKSSVMLKFSGNFDWNYKNRFVLQKLCTILQIKLREVLREDKSGVYGIGAYARIKEYPRPEYSVNIAFGCAPARVDELIKLVKEQIKDMQNNLPSDSNMVKIKQLTTRELEVNLKRNSYWATQFFRALYYNEPFDLFLKQKELINSIKPEDIQNAAKKYLNDKNYMQFVLYPEKK